MVFVEKNPVLVIMIILWPHLNTLIKVPNTKCYDVDVEVV